VRRRQPANKEKSGLPKFSWLAFFRSSKFIVATIFLFTTLILWIAGRDVAFVREDIMMIELFKTYPFNLAKIFTDGWTGLYGNAFPWIDWSYRPLEMVIDWGLVNLFGDSESLQILLKSAITGVCAALVYLLALELTQKRFVAIASAVFFAFSVPVVIESWWYHHMVSYTSIVIMLGLLAYLKYAKAKKFGWLAVFCLCTLIAPWLGEYGASLAVIVFLSVIIKRNWDWKLLAVSGLFILHGIYNNFLPNLLIEQKIVLTSIFSRFVPALAAEQGVLSIIQPGAPYLLILGTLTPILTLLAFTSLVFHFIQKRKEYPNYVLMLFTLLLILAIIFIRNYPPPRTIWGDMATMPFEAYYVLPTLFPILFALLSYRLNKFLALWFIVSYAPFLNIYHLSVNLFPAFIPWIILSCLWLVKLAEEIGLPNILKKPALTRGLAVPLVFIVVLIIGTAAQISNVAIAKETWGKAANNAREIGRFAKEHIPEGSLILGEQQSLFEVVAISHYSQGKVKGNFVVYDRYMWWPLEQIRSSELTDLLEADTTYPEKYFLIQRNVPQVLLRYLELNPERFELIKSFHVNSRVILIDPLHLILPEDVPYYKGFNIQRIYPSGGGPFYSQFRGDYTLFKYSSDMTTGSP